MKISREFKVGLVAIISLTILYWGLGYLQGSDLLEQKRIYYAVYQEVDGLGTARPVTINGYKVGQVEDIKFHPDNSGRLLVKLNITSDFQFGKETIASIYSSDLLGEKAIELKVDRKSAPAESGDTLISDVQLTLTEEVNKQVAPLKNKAEGLIASIDSVLIRVSAFLSDDMQQDFGKTTKSIRRSIITLEGTIQSINNTVKDSEDDLKKSFENISNVTTALDKNTQNLDKIIGNVESISDSLSEVKFKRTFASLERAVASSEQVLKKIEKGEGSAGKLINDPELYQNLEDASEQLNLLLLDVRYNPNRYVNFSLFGGKSGYSEKEIREIEKRLAKERAAADTTGQ